MAKSKKIEITKEDNLKIQKTVHRQTLIDMGLYNVHKNRIYKSKKEYKRKPRNKKDID